MVPLPPGPQSAWRRCRFGCASRAAADGADRAGARSWCRRAKKSASESAARSASPTFPMRLGRRLDLDLLTGQILRELRDRTCQSFRVSVRRADKRFPMTSPQVEREVGGRIKERARLEGRSRRMPSSSFTSSCSRTRRSTSSARSAGPAGCRPAPRVAWPACCRAASIRRWPRIG